MDRREFAKLLGTGAALVPALQAHAQTPSTAARNLTEGHSPTNPFDVGAMTQLFVDQVIVRESYGVAFTLHPADKHAKNPLLEADRPWEGWNVEIYGTVLYDEEEKIFKMWYLGGAPGYFPDSDKYANPCLYATSHDGITWEKPPVGTIQALKGGNHNAVALVDLASVIKDKEDPDPAKRYKMICHSWIDRPPASRGYSTMISPDGLNWKPFSTKPIARGFDVITGYYDEMRRLYVAMVKIYTDTRGFSRRAFYLLTSKDFEHWTEPQLIWTADLRDDLGSLARIEEVRPMLRLPDNPALMRTEPYGLGFYPTESCTLAFPWIFTINNHVPPQGGRDGPMEIQFASSRDLVNWDRHFRTPCIPHGAMGEWDSGMVYTQSRALRVADEIWLYYGGINATHACACFYETAGSAPETKYRGSIGLAKWKLDRFVSVDGPAEGGALKTIPIVFSGERLEVNARVKPGGSLSVEILDGAGHPMDGFEPSEPFRGDHLRQTITWRGSKGLAGLRGKPISLKFNLKSSELYSFTFR